MIPSKATIDQCIKKVQEISTNLQVVIWQAEKMAINRLRDEILDNECREIDGDLYKIGECIKEGARRGEGYYLARRYKVNGKLANYCSQVKMHYEPRDVDPDEGDYEEWEMVEEFYDGGK